MIHFDFTVEDVDAETIFDCINSTINRCNGRKLHRSTTKAESDCLSKHVDYLKSLKKKMLNTLV
jgi:hypothetical protein